MEIDSSKEIRYVVLNYSSSRVDVDDDGNTVDSGDENLKDIRLGGTNFFVEIVCHSLTSSTRNVIFFSLIDKRSESNAEPSKTSVKSISSLGCGDYVDGLKV